MLHYKNNETQILWIYMESLFNDIRTVYRDELLGNGFAFESRKICFACNCKLNFSCYWVLFHWKKKYSLWFFPWIVFGFSILLPYFRLKSNMYCKIECKFWRVRQLFVFSIFPPIYEKYAKMTLAQTNIIDNLREIWCIMHMCAINLTKLTKEKKKYGLITNHIL